MRLIARLPAAVALLVAHLCSAATVRVTDDGVKLRAAARPDSEIVGQVSRGATLKSTGQSEGEWVQVRPPASVSLWVFGDLIREGAVAANSLRVRSGPGIGYRPVGEIVRGTKVETRSRRGDWIEIVPPAGVAVWISKAFVGGGASTAARPVDTPKAKPVAKPAPKRAPKPAPKPKPPAPKPPAPKPVAVKVASRPVAKPVSKPWVAPPAPAPTKTVTRPPAARPTTRGAYSATPPDQSVSRRLRDANRAPERDMTIVAGQQVPRFLLDRVRQGEIVAVRGRVSRSGFLGYLFSYGFRLMQPQEAGWARSVCFLGGRETALDEAVGRSVALRGRRYWVQGRKLPVLMVDELQVLTD